MPQIVGSDDSALSCHTFLIVIMFAAGATYQGGYFHEGRQVIAVLLTLAVITSLVDQRWRKSDLLSGPVFALAVLAAWVTMRAAMADNLAGAGGTLLLIPGLFAVLLVLRRVDRGDREVMVTAALTVGILCALAGWTGVAWRFSPLALEDEGLWRAASALTYANGTAALITPLALLAVARTVAPSSGVLAAITSSLLLLGVGATLSRGGLLALAIGMVTLAVVLGPSQVFKAVAAPAAGAAIGLAGLSLSMPATSPPRPATAIFALLFGLGTVIGLEWLNGQWRGLFGIGATVALAATMLILAPQLAESITEIGGRRATLGSSDRRYEAAAAIRIFQQHPLIGVGPGNVELKWSQNDGPTREARYVHNEYLQVLVELGVVGFLLLCSVMGFVAATVARGRFHAPSTESWAGIVAGLIALGVHSGIDFLWHLPIIPLIGTLLVGLTFPIVMEEVAH